jgi:hypothetical protein
MASNAPSLPPDLKYLTPVVVKLSQITPVDREKLDPMPVIKAVTQRLSGLTECEAKLRLKADQRMLERWLRGRENDEALVPLWSILGILTHTDFDARVARGFSTPQYAFAKIPSTFRAWRRAGSLELSGQNLRVLIDPSDESDFTSFRELCDEWDCELPADWQVSHSEVIFGPVNGLKRVTVQMAVHRCVNYCLRVPGGIVSVAVHSTSETDGCDLDESPVESFLHTLHLRDSK